VSNRQKKDILVRLRRVEGQIRGIQRMIEEERECEAIVTQLMAARSALDRAGLFIMSHHIERCLSSSEGEADRDQLERIISFFLKFGVAPEPESEAQEGDVDVSEP
jgi:CsoR family transcriptional regulator, copper-sensing transcriptional repressor